MGFRRIMSRGRGVGKVFPVSAKLRQVFFFMALCFLGWTPLAGQVRQKEAAPLFGVSGPRFADLLQTRISGDLIVPAFGDETVFTPGVGVGASVELALFPFLVPSLQFKYLYNPTQKSEAVNFVGGGLGLDFKLDATEELSFRLGGSGGLYSASWKDISVANFYWGTQAEMSLRLSPTVSLALHGGFNQYLGSSEALLSAFSVGLTADLNLGGLAGGGRLLIEEPKLQSVFPVFYSYYDENSFGTVKITNNEIYSINDVTVSFVLGQYMDQAKILKTLKSVPKGESFEAPVYAILTDDVLSLTENTRIPGEIVVDYYVLNEKKQVRRSFNLNMNHRNAMNWDDDKRAAAFVSPNDSAVLWFSRFVAGLVRDRLRGEINAQLQYGAGLFEALKVYGINYVIDPSSSYVEKSSSETAVDYLQYPHQTLFFRGGDCDDLSILYAALLESQGIKTAFITIPGHIYMAFCLDISEQEARNQFYDPSLFIFHGGKAWIPVEITMVKEGFIKAWRIGAKEWSDNVRSGEAALYPMEESWKRYKPVGIRNVATRFSLPEESQVAQAFDEEINRYVAREIEPVIRDYRAKLAKVQDPELLNEMGVVYGRYGMLREAWNQFSVAAKADYEYAWTNLGNISFLRKDYKKALEYFEWALKANPGDSTALLGLARTKYELEYFDEAAGYYEKLKAWAPDFAKKYAYLNSEFGGEGRAWAYSERLGGTVWSDAETIKMAGFRPVPEDESVQIEPGPEAAAAPPEIAEEPAEEKSAVVASAVARPEIGSELPGAEEFTAPASAQKAALVPDPVAFLPLDPADVAVIAAAEARPVPAAAQLPPAVQAAEEPAVKEAPEVAVIAAAESRPVPDASVAPAVRESEEPAALPRENPIAAIFPAEARPVPEVSRVTPAVLAAEEPATKEPSAVTGGPPEVTENSTGVTEGLSEVRSGPTEVTESFTGVTKEPTGVTEALPVEVIPADDRPQARIAAAETGAGTGEKPSELAPAAAAGGALLLEGFSSFQPKLGTWEFSGNSVAQTDDRQFFAKLASPLNQSDRTVRYTFEARATGVGKVGLGLHIFVSPIKQYRLYGAGKSILVWLTQDPQVYGKNVTHLQVYRSDNEVSMSMVRDVTIPESIFEKNEVSLLFDPEGKTLDVFINGSVRLHDDIDWKLESGASVIFRAFDKAEFQNFRAEEKP